MRNAGLEEAQAGIKTAGRNINNLRYADDTTLMAESENELKSLLRKVKDESKKVVLKLNIQKTKIMASGPIRSDQIRSVAQSCPTLCDPMNRSTPGLPVHHQLPEFTQTHHLILCRPLLLLPPIPPSIRVFSNESTLRMMWPKYWSFSFSISASNEHPGLISFRMDWLDLRQSKGLSRAFSNTTVQKHQFFSTQLSSQSNSHIHT